MKSFYANLVVAACALHEGAAFSTAPPSRPSSLTGHQTTTLHAASVGSSNDATAKSPRSPVVHESREVETIRRELIEKYITLGHSEDYASREVNYFLEHSERSAQYVEMRRIAMARGNDLGIESIVQFAAAFVVGWAGSFMMHSFNELQVCTHHVVS